MNIEEVVFVSQLGVSYWLTDGVNISPAVVMSEYNDRMGETLNKPHTGNKTLLLPLGPNEGTESTPFSRFD